MESKGVVLVPVPADGHLVRTIELAKRLRLHSSDLSITILIIQTTFPSILSATPSTPQLIQAAQSSGLGITFLYLPAVEPPTEATDGLARMIIYIEKLKPVVMESLKSLSTTTTVSALILDMFCVTMVDVAGQLGIPAYVFYTYASGLSFRLYLPTLDSVHKQNFEDLKEMIHPPGWPPLPPLTLPQALHRKDNPAYALMVDSARRFRQLKGVLVNSFSELEPSAMEALASGVCVPDGPSPPAYPVGPLIRLENEPSSDHHDCIKWLDQQPMGSVLFLCFGSVGAFSPEQASEITRGLELSNHRFLWSLRVRSTGQGMIKKGAPSSHGSVHGGFVEPTGDGGGTTRIAPAGCWSDAVLPSGFLERTRDRGLVWFDRVPQVAILAHPAVGGFVSHCGWNSVLESIWFGVPVLAWPLYAEQKMNAALLEDGLGLAIGLSSHREAGQQDDGKIVTGEHLGMAIKRLMDGQDGEGVRERMARMKELARKAMSEEGGSSHSTLASMVAEWTTTRE